MSLNRGSRRGYAHLVQASALLGTRLVLVDRRQLSRLACPVFCSMPLMRESAPSDVPSGDQYAGCVGSIWRTQALTPPPTWTASASPAPCTRANTSAER